LLPASAERFVQLDEAAILIVSGACDRQFGSVKRPLPVETIRNGLPHSISIGQQITAGGELGISEFTVKAHHGQVMQKMKANSLADLVRMAVKLRHNYFGVTGARSV
jgi:hypothetical protein